MEIKTILHHITDELQETASTIDEKQLVVLENTIKEKDRIFIAGAGRSLLMIRGFAMRLMHMGFTTYVVGETTTPAIKPNDLLLIASGSGNTSTLVSIATKCKQVQATLALITTNPQSKIGVLADVIVQVRTSTSKTENQETKTFQPGGNTFEQLVLLIGDAIIIDIASSMNLEQTNAILMENHANLE